MVRDEFAHRGRPAARTGAVVGAKVKWHAHQRDVDVGFECDTRRA